MKKKTSTKRPAPLERVTHGEPHELTMMRALVEETDAPSIVGKCPDDGTCHHGCAKKCFRVQYCGPLSGVFPGDVWPAELTGRPLTVAEARAVLRAAHENDDRHSPDLHDAVVRAEDNLVLAAKREAFEGAALGYVYAKSKARRQVAKDLRALAARTKS